MRRPLALFALVFFFAALIAMRLPLDLLWVFALFCAAFFLCAVLFFKKRIRIICAIVSAALCVCFGYFGLYTYLFVQPVSQLSDTYSAITARVVELSFPSDNSDDTIHATVEVLSCYPQDVSGFRVRLYDIPAFELGDVVSMQVAFEPFSTRSSEEYNYTNGFYVAARAVSDVRYVQSSHTAETQLRSLQYDASANIMQKLPLRLSSLAAAMSVGDRRFIFDSAQNAYRSAGISHLLVVSGLHLSLLSSFLFPLLSSLTKRRRTAAVLCIAFTLFFVAFTGFTPSIIRSGVVFIFLYASLLFSRRADSFTSMGIAVLLLLLFNPYAAADVGLQLSFACTLGAILSGNIFSRLHAERKASKTPSLLRSIAHKALRSVFSSCCILLATLPVLISSGLSLSLLSIPVNIIAIPLLTPIVVCGFIMAIPSFVPLLGWLTLPASLICGALLSFLESITGLVSDMPLTSIHLEGTFGLVCTLCVYLLIYAAVRTGKIRQGIIMAAVLLVTALGLHFALSRSTVRMSLVGSGTSSSLVITQNAQSIILYRGLYSLDDILYAMETHGSSECVLLIDMLKEPQASSYENLIFPESSLLLFEDIPYRTVLQPTESVQLHLLRQEEGGAVCVDVNGYKLLVGNGRLNLEYYTPVDVLIPGISEINAEYTTLLTNGSVPSWVTDTSSVIYGQGEAMLWIRPGRSVVLL